MNNELLNHAVEENHIAVIAMSGRFPGAKNIDEFWDNLTAGKDTIYQFTDQELYDAGVLSTLINNPNYVKSRGILTGIDQFDAKCFGMSPYEAAMTDPQHRIFLEICREALEQSGHLHAEHDTVIGVFAGMSDSTYLKNCLLKNDEFVASENPFQTQIATSGNFLATKVSYHLNLKGPSININTACSTSLVTVIKACQSLLAFECDIAMAGGVSLSIPTIRGYLYQEGGILSKDGKCRPFDKDANGTVSSSGAGVVILKRLSDALKDGDLIDAVIIGHAINNDGSAKVGYTAPSIIEQSRCIATAIANIDVESITYVEAHGTGTALGDPIEMTALTKSFSHYTSKKNYCALGSVKGNIGHADVAAGVAGLIKTILCLKHKMIPATLHFQEGNPKIDFLNSPFYVNTALTAWETEHSLRRAGVSSFGIGGTNAHVVLEEVPHIPESAFRKKISLPTYEFKKTRHWVNPSPCKNINAYYLYKYDWVVSPILKKSTSKHSENWLIFSVQGHHRSIIDYLKSISQNVICVFAGDSFLQIEEDFYQINPNLSDDYRELFKILNERKKLPDQVLHFWSFSHDNNSPPIEYETTCFLSLVYFSQIFLNLKKHLPLNFTIITNYLKKILPHDTVIPEKAILIGASLVIPQEYGNVIFKIIDCQNPDFLSSKTFSKNLIQETFENKKSNMIAYRNGMRLCQHYLPYMDQNNCTTSYLRKNGVYLITGAFGRIGINLAQYLAITYSAHLILVSHKPFKTYCENLDISNIMKIIKEHAASIKIIQANVTDYAQMNQVLIDIENTPLCLDGIFHLAATTHDLSVRTLIKDLDLNQISKQFLPKIEGAKVIAKLSQNFPIDFCCLYSSLSSVIGGVGLASYAASNAYLDSAAELYQTETPTRWISINWDAINSSPQMQSEEVKLTLENMFNSLNISLSHHNCDSMNANMAVSIAKLEDKIEKWMNPCEIKDGSLNDFDEIVHGKDKIQITADYFEIFKNVENIFKNCLGLPHVSAHASFYALGGDSLAAIRLLEMIENSLHFRVKLQDLIENNSIEKLSVLIEKSICTSASSCLVKLNEGNNDRKLFLIHPVGGAVFCYLELAKYLEKSVTCYGIQDPSLDAESFTFKSIEEMASEYLRAILKIQPTGEYFMGGFSLGGSLAFEIARQLMDRGKKVRMVFIIDAWAAFSSELRDPKRFSDAMQYTLELLGKNIPENYLIKERLLTLAWHRMQLLFQYSPPNTHIPITLFKANQVLEEYAAVDNPTNHWENHTNGMVAVHRVEGDHKTILEPNHVAQIADILSQYFNTLGIHKESL